MKLASSVVLAGAMVGLVGCASVPRVAVTGPVGPGPVAAQGNGNGALVIYSARAAAYVDFLQAEWRWNNDFGRNAFLTQPAHSDYVVYSESGEVVRQVRNAHTANDETPTVVTLPPGTYRVEAEAVNCDGARIGVEMTAVIQAGRTTVAHLGDHWSPPAPYKATDVAKLPCGRIVGWRATSAGYASAGSGS